MNISIKIFRNSVLNIIQLLIITVVLVLGLASCKKLVDVDPPSNKVTGESVFSSDATATAVLTGLYIKLSTTPLTSNSIMVPSLTLLGGLSADELTLWSGSSNARRIAYYKNNLLSNPDPAISFGGEFWFWTPIFTCNSAVEALTSNNQLTPAVRNQLLGEAKFMRAFYYFYLVNLYGDLPLVLTTDYKVNSSLSRSPVSAIYNQIIKDLNEAKDLLSPDYLNVDLVNSSQERVRPTKWAAYALLARSYLYNKEWAKAEQYSSLVINNTSLYDTVSLNGVFLMNSKEAIWQLQPVNEGWNTEVSKAFMLPATGPNNGANPVYLSNQLLAAFEANDKRRIKGNWVDSINVNGVPYVFPFKYKSKSFGAPITEYLMVLRLAEQYLIRAEARAQLNNIPGATEDLNIVRFRAGLPGTTANDAASIIDAIQRERQVELFTEWGERWLNLKRTQSVNTIMGVVTPMKGGTWAPHKALYPLPYREILVNQNMTQNSGY